MPYSHGMNIAAIQQIAVNLHRQAQEIDRVVHAGDAIVIQAQQNWSGSNSHAFVTDWQHNHRPKLVKVSLAVAALADAAKRNAAAQEQTSSQYAASGSGGPSAPNRSGSDEPSQSGAREISQEEYWNIWRGTAGGGDLLIKMAQLGGLHAPSWNANIEGMIKANPALSSLLLVPEVVSALESASKGELSLSDYMKVGGSAFQWGDDMLSVFAKSGAGAVTGKALGVFGAGLQAGSDFVGAVDDFNSGNYAGGLYNVIHGGAEGVAMVCPTVGLCVGAWDVGIAIGTAIANSPASQQAQDNLVAYGAQNDPDIATRYDVGKRGVAAVENIVTDGWHSIFG